MSSLLYCSAAVLTVMFLNLYPGHLVPNIVTRSRSGVFGCVSVIFGKMLVELTRNDLDILVLYTWASVRNCRMYNKCVIVHERPDTIIILEIILDMVWMACLFLYKGLFWCTFRAQPN